MREKFGRGRSSDVNDHNRMEYLARGNVGDKPYFLHFIGKSLYKILDTSKSVFKFRGYFLKWGSDEDYEECSEDFQRAKLYNMHPLHFISRSLVIIADRLLDEYLSVKFSNPSSNTAGANLPFCVSILKLLLRPRDAWRRDGMTQAYFATLSVRGYCYTKLLEIYKKVDFEEAKKGSQYWNLLNTANCDSDVTKVDMLSITDSEQKSTKKRAREIDLTSPSSTARASQRCQ
jgi:hypothetical protein